MLSKDFLYAFRGLRKSPVFAITSVVTLALGIGASTAIFSLMNAVMLRLLPVQKPQELVLFGSGGPMGVTTGFPRNDWELFSYPLYREFQQKNQVFSGMAAIQSLPNEIYATMGGSQGPEPVSARLVSGTYFSVLGVNPILGRVFSDSDDQTAGAHPVAVASYTWWKRRFESDRSAVGQHFTVGSTVYTIIGIAPPEFFGTTVGESPDVWIPLAMQAQLPPGWPGYSNREFHSLYLVGRLKPGVSREQAAANTNVLFKQILHDYAGPAPDAQHLADIEHVHITLTPAATGLSRLRFRVSMPLQILLAVVGLVLLIACANIASLLLAHGSAREREIAIRMSVGAGRSRLIRQLLSESLVLSFLGGALGIGFAWWASHLLLSMVSAGLGPIALDLAMDRYVLAFTVLVSVGTALLFGMAPAFRATRVELLPSLKDGKGLKLGRRGWLARTLVVSQVALSLVLLVGAGLLLHSLVNLANVATGFDKQNAMVVHLDPSATGYAPRSPQATNLYQQLEQRVEAIPGVRAASFALLSFGEGAWREQTYAEGFAPSSENDRNVHNNMVGPDFFAAMGIPLVNGRLFTSQDTATSPRVAVINQTMAQRFFPNQSPVGKRFGLAGQEHSNEIEVIGVVRNAKVEALDEPPFPEAYFPYTQYANYGGGPGFLFELIVRYQGDSASIATDVRQAIASVNRSVPIADVSTLSEQVGHSVVPQSIIAQLSSFFGLFAVFLACLGIYGLLAYAVSQRTNEIGIRLALGAGRGNVRWLVIREALLLVAIGLLIGIPAAFATNRVVASMLFGLGPSDPISFLTAAGLTLMVAALAAYIPARRAMKVEPMVALRYE